MAEPVNDLTVTAAQIAAALGIKPQSVRGMLRDIRPAGVRIIQATRRRLGRSNQLPKELHDRLDDKAVQQRCIGLIPRQRIEILLAMPRRQWQPAIPLDKISDRDIQIATKLRDALKPWLIGQHDLNLSATEIESRGIEDYRRFFGNRITTRHWRELFMRTIAATIAQRSGTDWKFICRIA